MSQSLLQVADKPPALILYKKLSREFGEPRDYVSIQNPTLRFRIQRSFSGKELVHYLWENYTEFEQKKLARVAAEELLEKFYILHAEGKLNFADTDEDIYYWTNLAKRNLAFDASVIKKHLINVVKPMKKENMVEDQSYKDTFFFSELKDSILEKKVCEITDEVKARDLIEWMVIHRYVAPLGTTAIDLKPNSLLQLTNQINEEAKAMFAKKPLKRGTTLIGSSRSLTTSRPPPLGQSHSQQGPLPAKGDTAQLFNTMPSIPISSSGSSDSVESLALKNFGVPRVFNEKKTPSQASLDNSTVGFFLAASQTTLSELCGNLQRHLSIQDRKFNLKTYKQCFVASDAVDYLMSSIKTLKKRSLAIEICEALFKHGYIEHVAQKSSFQDGQFFYRFPEVGSIIDAPLLTDTIENQKHDLEDIANRMKKELKIKDRKYHFKVYEKCFIAAEAVDWILKNISNLKNRSEAVEIGQLLQRAGYIRHTANRPNFSDGELFYRFVDNEEKQVTISEFLSAPLSAESKARNVTMSSLQTSLGSKKEKVYAHFLMEFDDLEPPKLLLGLNKSFKEKIEGIIDKAKESNKSWAVLMQDRLVATEALLTPKQISHWEKCLHAYCKASGCPKSTELLGYLMSHMEDPNNSIIGLTPSSSICKEFQMNPSGNTSAITKEELIEKILLWGSHITESGNNYSLPNSDLEELLSYSTTLTQGGSFAPGEIALLKTGDDNEPYLYVRIQKDCGETLNVYISPDETQISSDIIRSDVLKLPKNIKRLLKNSPDLRTITFDSVDYAWNLIVSKIGSTLDQYLLSQGVIPSLQKAQDWRSHKYEPSDEANVKKCILLLKQISRVLPPEMKESLKDLDLSDIKSSAMKTLKYIPTRAESAEKIEILCKHARSDLVTNSISTFLVICEFIANHITVERDDILSGNRKDQLAQWWLNLIQDRTKEFLENQGYDFDAVPVDYIDQAPKNIDDVKRNLKIVKTCLSTYKDYIRPRSTSLRRLEHKTELDIEEFKNSLIQNSMVALVEVCRKEVYNKLDEFANRAQCFIYLYLKEEPEISEGLLKRTDLPENIQSAIKDVLYVKKMKLLENQKTQAESKDIVPVIGLVLNCFFRQENELETVLEVWEKRLVRAETEIRNSDEFFSSPHKTHPFDMSGSMSSSSQFSEEK